ncbi:hypothetical protein [Actinocatenispora sera]|uniref:hypothetical protein n=1 Tax=Actinocatenispora sera TaxID=390989 RepID=UPI0004C2BA3F|nr:hypothetical protein [Actinocatenispora sera]
MRASHDEPRWPGEHRTVVLYLVAALVSHLADAELSRQLRLRLADISPYAAGLVRRWVAGRVRTPVQDDVAALHHAIVHARGELYSAVAGPAVIVHYLLWTDPLLAVVTVALVAAAQSVRMRMARRWAEPVGRIAAAAS